MATWHQQRRPVQLWHETEWTVVSDPPNGLRTLARWSTEERAREHLAGLVKHGNGAHAYVIPPARREQNEV